MLIFGENKMVCRQWSPQNTWLQVDYLCIDDFNLEILPHGFVMQCQILINKLYSFSTCWICRHTRNSPIIVGNALKYGRWFCHLTVPNIWHSHLYHGTIPWDCLDPTKYSIYGVHCIGIPRIKIRRLIFIIGIPVPISWHLYIDGWQYEQSALKTCEIKLLAVSDKLL